MSCHSGSFGFRFSRASVVCAAAGLTACGGLLVAGPLNPPAGPVASTYKTLAEVEPRIAINAANTPGDNDSLFKITKPGSYYLTGDLTGVTGKAGIEIASGDITIDLSGFSVIGTQGATSGIRLTLNGASNINVRNGSVRSWTAIGVDCGMESGMNTSMSDLILTGNGYAGLLAGVSARVSRCSASKNGAYGIFTLHGAVVTDCLANSNGIVGFIISDQSTVANCTATLNMEDGFNTGSSNTIIDCTSTNNGTRGISILRGTRASGNVVRENGSHGIIAYGQNTIEHNSITGNGTGAGGGSGLRIMEDDNRIQDNNSVRNATHAFHVTGSGNVLLRNTASGSTLNWNIAPFNPGLIVASQGIAQAVVGNSGGATIHADPNANVTY